MSRLTAVLLALLACGPALAEPPALAEKLTAAQVKDPAGEMVYRASLGRADDIALLLSMKASANQKNAEGVPVLSLAAARRDEEALKVAQLLLTGGADINAKDRAGQSALFYAVRYGRTDMLQWLLEHKIDYYAPDSDGNIARTVAYRMDKQDLVTLMDDFVKRQSAEIQKQYDEYNKAVAAQQAEARRAEDEAAAKANAEAAAEREAYLEKVRRQGTADFAGAKSDLAYESCAFQYWAYVQATGQKTALSPQALEQEVDTHRSHVRAALGVIAETYAAEAASLDAVSAKAKQLVFDQIDSMLSKTERFENGVGTKADMEKRCGEIGKHWDSMPLMQRDPPENEEDGNNPSPRG